MAAPSLPFAQFATAPAPITASAVVQYREVDYGSDKISAFLSKTYDMVTCDKWASLITWGPKGNSFIVHSKEALARDVLPTVFKHSNFSSFIRQLNMYGFHKIGDPQHFEFCHDFFVKDRPELLRKIKRKSVTNRPKAERERLAQAQAQGRTMPAAPKEEDDDGCCVCGSAALAEELQAENVALRDELKRLKKSMQNIEQFLQKQFPTGSSTPSRKRERPAITSGFRMDPSKESEEPARKRGRRSIEVSIPVKLEDGDVFSGLQSLGLTPQGDNAQHLPLPPLGITPRPEAGTPCSPGLTMLLEAAGGDDDIPRCFTLGPRG